MKLNINTGSSLLNVILREIHRIGERKTIYFLSILLPIGLFILLSLIYKNEVVRDLPVAVYDADRSEVSRMLTRAVDASSSMRVITSLNSIEEVKSEFMKGNIQAAFYFPKGMSEDLKSGKGSSAALFKNSANLIIGNLIYKDGMTIIRTFSGGMLLKKLRSKGLPEDRAMKIVNPIRIETYSLYNPGYNYLSYLIPGLIVATFQMIIMIAGVLVISSEFTHNTFPELLSAAKGSILTIILGKSIPHLLIHFATSLGIVGIIFPIFSIDINGSVFMTIMLLFYFICAVFFMSMLISSIFHEQLFATEIALFINTPAFIFSGFTFPLWGMPMLHNYFAQIIPFTHFLTGFLKIYQMNTPFRYIAPEFGRLSIFLVISLAGIVIALNYQVTHFYRNSLAANAPEEAL